MNIMTARPRMMWTAALVTWNARNPRNHRTNNTSAIIKSIVFPHLLEVDVLLIRIRLMCPLVARFR